MSKKKKVEEEKVEEVAAEEKIEEVQEEITEDEETLEDKMAKIEADLEDWKSAYARKNAEFQNFTKRKQNELEEFRKYASEKVILKVLEAVDNLERGVAASVETKDFDALVKGVEMTLTQMHGIMNAEGVEPIEAVGKEYDPHVHQAVMTENCETMDNDHITMELQKGYKMKGKVIRPSMVKVCKK
ncbi:MULTISPECIES: nucleotide exchange factor GrpE [Psychrilyobacter]|uniref:Protein GrpE n=1 Tax=Psychrilyobacter piezotolerans TaxID=2293438 RepID=A0ABX9KG71_9FUSO|nr:MULTISPECIES: nucleotide exchange factor GrpE [Psychrilyobacter]MCS5422462.1 nucleotide exchange factor GrpE [Psychrilyobacter sp. S5]NDI78360.1 nucleotide exchange factor GrpE [Psychrilyobacter piezotolerans]RDE61089.1 nucleotide exchange factor GrpE [Psychrilyobacter sp. S5]REI40730.1 nucleotide exchange factor GrpE [Psychrilyobacter piezotolerans]